MLSAFCSVRCKYCSWLCCSFFFKQKTAYEMRISDWSSDVCSSDLPQPRPELALHETARLGFQPFLPAPLRRRHRPGRCPVGPVVQVDRAVLELEQPTDGGAEGGRVGHFRMEIGRAHV